MGQHFAHLKLPFECDLEHLARFECEVALRGHVDVDKRLLPIELTKFLAMRSMRCIHLEAFHTPPQDGLWIHVDNDRLSNLSKLNFVYGASGSTMAWWKLKPGVQIQAPAVNRIGKYHIGLYTKDCIEVERTEIGTPTLVNVGQPHSVTNNTDERRWCLSVVLGHMTSAQPIEYKSVLFRLSNMVMK